MNINYAANSGAGNPNNFFQVSIGGSPATDDRDFGRRFASQRPCHRRHIARASAETIQEFQISTLGFDLSSGTVSAGVVNIVSRTGTNDLHGSGFFFFRDHSMAAFPGLRRPCDPSVRSPLCDNPSSLERLNDPFFVRRQYGGTIGGPIKKDKLFFFGNYERNNQVGAVNLFPRTSHGDTATSRNNPRRAIWPASVGLYDQPETQRLPAFRSGQ